MTDVSAIDPSAARTAATSASASGDAGSATDAVADQMGADVFLQLLVAQLKYQDPTSPAKGTEFLAQTAQFTMVEKLTQLADHAEAGAVTSRNLGAVSMVGRQISWLKPDGTYGHGLVETARLGTAGPVLVVDGTDVPFDSVASVSDAPDPSSSTDASTTPAATDGTPGATAS